MDWAAPTPSTPLPPESLSLRTAPAAVATGQAAYTCPGSGLVVIVDHGQGIATLYAHASALSVTAGQPVDAGEVIAWVGSTGNHLHFQVYMGHPPMDGTTAQAPEAFLRSVGVDS